MQKDFLLQTNLFEDGEYLNKYFEIIQNNSTTQKTKFTQRHHIVPKCVYTYLHLSADNTKTNLVNLAYKDHIQAHYFLYKASIEQSSIKHILGATVVHMTNESSIDLSEEEFVASLDEWVKLYECFCKKNDEQCKGKHLSEHTKKLISEKNTGKHRSPETIELLRQQRLGTHRSEETKQKMGDIQRGRKMCYEIETGKTRYYFPDREPLPEGCADGMSPQKCAQMKEISSWKEGHKPWNTGMVTPDYIRKKISDANKGHKLTPEQCAKISKAQKGLKKRPHTEEEKQRISQASKDRIWIHNPDTLQCKMVKDYELEEYLAQGFVKGRIYKRK